MMKTVLRELRRLRIIPLVVIDDPANAGPLAAALAGGGLPCVEIAFRTRGAMEALRRIAAEHPDVLVGAGTVLTEQQVRQAKEAGARFVVSPGINPRVVDCCRDQEIAVYPGVCTPTEIEAALTRGLEVLKFFPAEPMGGLPFLRAIAAPFSGVDFIPTGGITTAHLAGYLGFDRVVACGGSWMAQREWIAAGEFDRIRDEVRRAVRAADRSQARDEASGSVPP
jgi:2-dehydro-3-deoxyphosphogluconate aldolase/(4S)-4-hydroxy-2-oxoglutarate aldolase